MYTVMFRAFITLVKKVNRERKQNTKNIQFKQKIKKKNKRQKAKMINLNPTILGITFNVNELNKST